MTALEAVQRKRHRRVSHRPGPRGKARPPKPAENYYPHVYAFVTDWLAEVYAHDTSRAFRWCPEWWRHPAALTRLEATWKAWEKLRTDPGAGASVWFRDHGDPCINYLTAERGPFIECSNSRHNAPPPLPTTEPPAWLLADLSDQTITLTT